MRFRGSGNYIIPPSAMSALRAPSLSSALDDRGLGCQDDPGTEARLKRGADDFELG